jgi:hypothetical protein
MQPYTYAMCTQPQTNMNAPPSAQASARAARTVTVPGVVSSATAAPTSTTTPTLQSKQKRLTKTVLENKNANTKGRRISKSTRNMIIGVVVAVLIVVGSVALLWYTYTRGNRNDAPNIVPAQTPLTPGDVGFTGTCPFDTNNQLFCTIFPWTANLVENCGVFDPSQVNDTCQYTCDATLNTWLQVGLWPDDPNVGLTRAPNASDSTQTPDAGHNEACALANQLATYAASPGSIMPSGTSSSDLDGASRLFASMSTCISSSYFCG